MSSTPEEEIRELVALATLGEGVLRMKDEHRILKVALARGVPPQVARATIDAALAAAGARRPEKDVLTDSSGVTSALDAKSEKPAETTPAEPKPEKPIPEDATLTSDAIKRAISRKLEKVSSSTHAALAREAAEASANAPTSAPAPTSTAPFAVTPAAPSTPRAPDEEVAVVAEVVVPSPPTPAEAPLGICAGCLAQVYAHDVAAGRAAREPDGRLHCRNCLSRLEAGLLCDRCYRPIDRALLADGRAITSGDRAIHAACVPPAAAPPAPAPRTSGGGAILGPSSVEITIGGGTPPTKPTSTLGVKCAGCYVTLTRVQFEQGRARRIEGVPYCDACAQRASRGRG